MTGEDSKLDQAEGTAPAGPAAELLLCLRGPFAAGLRGLRFFCVPARTALRLALMRFSFRPDAL